MNEPSKYVALILFRGNLVVIGMHVGGGIYQMVGTADNVDMAREMVGSMNDRIELRKVGP